MNLLLFFETLYNFTSEAVSRLLLFFKQFSNKISGIFAFKKPTRKCLTFREPCLMKFLIVFEINNIV